ncbi:MAG: BRCT domain-containing protein [Gammaproteobacteria bacterium]|jgi:NAD-dependent DNA ligase
MAEMSFTLYVKSTIPDKQERLDQLIDIIGEQGGEDWTIIRPMMKNIISEIARENADRLLDELINSLNTDGYGAEDFTLDYPGKYQKSGYLAFNMLFGSTGPENTRAVVKLFGGLDESVDARGYLIGDEDPWEVFYRQIEDEILMKECVPDEDFDADCEALETGVYAWWHKGLPSDINEGYLNDNDLDDVHISFMGDFQRATREKMEKIAEEYGANVQKAIDDETMYLVVGANTEKPVLSDARDMGITLINEDQFYSAVEE